MFVFCGAYKKCGEGTVLSKYIFFILVSDPDQDAKSFKS